jgi:hypothetical protein
VDELATQVVDEDHGGGRHHAAHEEDAHRYTIAVCHRWRWARAERQMFYAPGFNM